MEDIMTPEEFKDRMEEIARNTDIEIAHADGDELMMNLLESLGYSEGVMIFNCMDKWCA